MSQMSDESRRITPEVALYLLTLNVGWTMGFIGDHPAAVRAFAICQMIRHAWSDEDLASWEFFHKTLGTIAQHDERWDELSARLKQLENHTTQETLH